MNYKDLLIKLKIKKKNAMKFIKVKNCLYNIFVVLK